MNTRPKDVEDASQALLNWLDSQELDPDDAVRVLTITLVSVIHEIAMTTGRDRAAGGRVIAKIIKDALS